MMKDLATLFAAAALAVSTAALALPGEPKSQVPSQELSSKSTEGFVVIQRNIYVPVDADGKPTSNEWVVVDKQGFVTAEEMKIAQAEAEAAGKGHGADNESDSERKDETPKSDKPSPRTEPAAKSLPLGSGTMILS